jgi:hypothetical protein
MLWNKRAELHERSRANVTITSEAEIEPSRPQCSIVDSIAAPNSPSIGAERLERDNITIEISHPTHGEQTANFAFEITYEGQNDLAEETLIDIASKLLDEHIVVFGAWVA